MKNRKLRHVRAALKIALVSVICIGGLFAVREIYVDDPGKLLVEYMDHIEKQEYSQMYEIKSKKFLRLGKLFTLVLCGISILI